MNLPKNPKMEKSEKEMILKAWEKLDEIIVIKEVVTKGQYINTCINFLSSRKSLSQKEAKEYFLEQVNNYVHSLIRNKQLFKAQHILNHIELESKYTFYQILMETNDSELRNNIMEHLNKTIELYELEEVNLKNNYIFYETLRMNLDKVASYLEKLNKKYSANIPTIELLTFDVFMRQNAEWRKKLAVDLFFKTKFTALEPSLDKHTLWSYLLKNDHYSPIKNWLKEQYYCRKSTTNLNTSLKNLEFDDLLIALFRRYSVDRVMLEKITHFRSGGKENILYELAKMGLFTVKEDSDLSKKLQRLITTETFKENREIITKEQIADYVVKNNLIDLLTEDFIDDKALQKSAETEKNFIKPEIELVQQMKSLLSKNTDISKFLSVSKQTSTYLSKEDSNFYAKNPIIHFVEEILAGNSPNLYESQLPFLKAIAKRLDQEDDNLDVGLLLLKFHSVNLKLIEFEVSDAQSSNSSIEVILPGFDNETLCEKYSKEVQLDSLQFVKNMRSSHAVYHFLVEQLNTNSKITKMQITSACSKVAELAVDNFENDELVSHCVAFIEMLGINTSCLRSFLRLIKKVPKETASKQKVDLISFLNNKICFATQQNGLNSAQATRDVQSLKTYMDLSNSDATLFCFEEIIKENDWFKMIIVSQYLNCSLDSVIKICDQMVDTYVGTNLKHALFFNLQPEAKKKCSFTRRREPMANDDKTIRKSVFNKTKFLHDKLHKDLFAILLMCDSQNLESPLYITWDQFIATLHHKADSPCENLLQFAVARKWSLLALLAAQTNTFELKYCWLTWLSINSNFHCSSSASKDESELIKSLIIHTVVGNFKRTLLDSLKIFYPESDLVFLIQFILRTSDFKFDAKSIELLKKFILQINNPLLPGVQDVFQDKLENIEFTTNLIMMHLKMNFHTLSHQQLLLKCLCESDISYFSNKMDFHFLNTLCNILEMTKIEINFDLFTQSETIIDEYQNLCDQLVKKNYFQEAITVADHLQLPKDQIVYQRWLSAFCIEGEAFTYKKCVNDLAIHKLKPELVINFYLHVTRKMTNSTILKYNILKKILELISKYNLHPSDVFDRDRVEFDMTVCFIQLNDEDSKKVKIMHSDHFREIVKEDRGVIYSSFTELKEIAGIDDLTINLQTLKSPQEIENLNDLVKRLLDDCDLVQALRIQAMFDQRPIDLHLLVYCMALAEGLVTLYDLPKEERKVLNSGGKSANNRFNRMTLRSNRLSFSSTSSSPSKTPLDTSIDYGSVFDDSSSSRDKQDIFDAIQGLACKIDSGNKLTQRIVLLYRVSMSLDREYLEILKVKSTHELLEACAKEDCPNKLLVLNDIMTAAQMDANEIAQFMSNEITNSIAKSRFYMFNQSKSPKTVVADILWGFNLEDDFHLLLELCPNTSLLGNQFLLYYSAIDNYSSKHPKPKAELNSIAKHLHDILGGKVLSLKKQNTIKVELLIKAHDSFVKDCHLEGIGIVLQKAKTLCGTLSSAKSWHLIVRMLCGLGRFREMYYCFEILIKNDQFESLLGQFKEKSTGGLKTSLISFLNEYYPHNKEYFRMVASHFLMNSEMAQIWEVESKEKIDKLVLQYENSDRKVGSLGIPVLTSTKNLINPLQEIMDDLVHSCEFYLPDNRMEQASKVATQAELVALQIHLANSTLETNQCISVLSLEGPEVFKHFVNHELSVPQSLILARAYRLEIDWVNALYSHYITKGDDSYLQDYRNRVELTDNMIETMVKIFQLETNISPKMEQSISNLILLVKAVNKRYKLASLLGLKNIISSLINSPAINYLKDTNYGRSAV